MPPPSLDEVANLSLSVGKLFLETGASARTVHEAVEEISRAFGCEKAEAYCQHAAIIVMLRRGADSCVQMGKVGEHGVNLRRVEALSRILSHIALGEIDCAHAQREVAREEEGDREVHANLEFNSTGWTETAGN